MEYEKNHDENEVVQKEQDVLCDCNKHPVAFALLIAFSVLLGSFLAVYTVADHHYRKMTEPYRDIQKLEKKLMKQYKAFDKDFEGELRNILRSDSFSSQNFYEFGHNIGNGVITLDEADNAYIIIVDLNGINATFDNVFIETDIEGNEIEISIKNENKTKYSSDSFSVNKTYRFSKKVDFAKISQMQDNNKIIINVPTVTSQAQ